MLKKPSPSLRSALLLAVSAAPVTTSNLSGSPRVVAMRADRASAETDPSEATRMLS